DPAYIRRVTWAAGRYAVLYHILLGKDGLEVGQVAMRWAWRAVLLHLQYAKSALALSDAGFAQKLDKIMDWTAKQIEGGANVESALFVRSVLQHFRRDLSNAQEARQIIDLVRKTA
ncbi:Holliday junction resolvase, partial [mine drainage metagenome]